MAMATRPWRLAGLAGAMLLTTTTVAATGAPAAAAAPSPQGTVYVSDGGLYLAAGFGARNYVTVGTVSGGRTYLTDNIAFTLDRSRSGGCVQNDAWSVTCPTTITRVVAHLGDGDDYFGNYSYVTSTVFGDYGNDDLWGWFGTEYFHGGPDNDELYGLPGADQLWGDDGADVLEGHEGDDHLYGGSGNDTLRGHEGWDFLYGHDGTDDLSGGPDRDDLDGGPGLGTIAGDAGNDVFYHRYSDNSSRNNYWGGAGIDEMDYWGMTTGVHVTLNNIADDYAILPVVTGHNVHDDIEKVVGTDNADHLIGSDGPNTLIGLSGDDVLEGLGGNDDLNALTGNNQRVYGGPGTDTCDGDDLVVADQCEAVPA